MRFSRGKGDARKKMRMDGQVVMRKKGNKTCVSCIFQCFNAYLSAYFASGAARTNAPGQEIGENTKKMEANRPRPCHLRVASRLRASAHFPRTPGMQRNKISRLYPRSQHCKPLARLHTHFPRTPENKGTKRASRALVRRVASRLRFRKLPRLFCGRRAKVLLRRLRTCRSFRVPSRTGRGSLFHGYAL